MKSSLRAFVVISGASLLLGGDCMFGRPIVDERGRYYPSDGVISCTGTRCADLPVYELSLPAAVDSPCAQELPAADLEAAVRTGPLLNGMRFTLTSEQPRDLSLDSVDMRDACVVLSGPVRLTLGAGSRLTHVTVLLGPSPIDPDAGVRSGSRATPNLYLGHAALDRVSLAAHDARGPSGSAQLEFSSCIQCETRIDALNVTETQVQNSRLGAESLTVVGGAFDSVELAFGYGLLAGVLANDMRTTTCNTLSLVGATIAGRASKIGPCDCGRGMADAGAASDAALSDADRADADELDAAPADASGPDAEQADGGDLDAGAIASDAGPADSEEDDAGDAGASDEACNGATITQSTFFGGMVDGIVRAENSTFRSVLFARHAPTSLDMWSTNIELSVACSQAIDIRLDKSSGIGCTSCDAEGTASACMLDRAPELTVNNCQSFSGRLPACEPPLPTRMTPAIPRPPKLGQ